MTERARETIRRHAVEIGGVPDGQPMMFAHGYGCDQNMWRLVAPAFAGQYRVVLFDHIGVGRSDLRAYDPTKYATLDGYADDVLTIVDDLDLHDVVFVGHSVSAMIGVLAAIREPARFADLVLVGPSPSYIDDGDYIGGFSRADIDDMMHALDSNYLGWSSVIAPMIMANPQRPELSQELVRSFCATDPAIAKKFAHVTFLSDNRGDLASVRTPSLIMQCTDDIIAPRAVGEYVHDHMPGSTLVVLNATGHCPNLSAPEETIDVMTTYLSRR
ncbi:hydrolase [Paractinoplanes abujensis]|uniref:Sigma-B regulation protein RsbQ n=1 Tax=Paractinoplanes abujensis TaxID=882441 RepID=A0A7W7G0L4_9ACTN|nr:alpha/beta hydrolase [Actinoplanes abujensis]MBB4693188.1 sigma-B regulation protein RsbQ [Actinoplanes abujensis]GID24388.1 hydrolase [Actinoplanes abujensis]